MEAGQIDHYWGTRALEFVDQVEAATSPEALMALFARTIGEAGFSAFVMCGLPDAQTSFRDRILANGWPPEWSAIYLREELARHDPVERHCLHSVEPFDWSEARYDPEREPKAAMVMHRAVDFHMAQGFCVPIHFGDGPGAAVSIAGERPDFGRGVRPAMHLMALYAHNRMRSLLRPAKVRRVLTEREREVLKWVALGKTSWEISVILKISERTANAHVNAAARKLDAPNRIAAVVNALRRGEIEL
jgi:LuxR family quorum sensing-dependent transcriptional regulator